MGKAKRNKGLSTPERLFQDAFPVIQKMEACCCYRTVTCDFTVNDVIEWLWPVDILDKLRAAKPYAQGWYNRGFNERILVAGEIRCNIKLNLEDSDIMVPAQGVIRFQDTPKSKLIVSALQQVGQIHAQWEQVRRVLTWLNDNATPGAAKYYFPSLGALLPLDHSFHKMVTSDAVSNLYREPKRPIGEIAADMRAAMTTIAMGLVSYSDKFERTAVDFKVRICHKDDNGNDTSSQEFSLI